MEKRKLPWVNFPSAKQNPQQGSGHRTVNIRAGKGSVSIRCASRQQAEQLGMGLIRMFREACTPITDSGDPVEFIGSLPYTKKDPEWHIWPDPTSLERGWYFWDESWVRCCGPFGSRHEANLAVKEYVKTL